MFSADDEDAADGTGEGEADLTSYPMPSKAMVGGLPSIQACTFHSAACAVLSNPLGTYFNHLYPPGNEHECDGLKCEKLLILTALTPGYPGCQQTHLASDAFRVLVRKGHCIWCTSRVRHDAALVDPKMVEYFFDNRRPFWDASCGLRLRYLGAAETPPTTTSQHGMGTRGSRV